MDLQRETAAGDSAPGPPADVVVVGGGFAGMACAEEAARGGLRVRLVDATGTQQFQPLLYQVATGLLPADDVQYPLTDLSGVDVVVGRATGVDLARRVVTLEDDRRLVGRHVVLASGGSVTFFGVPGAAEHSLPLYTLSDAQAIHVRLAAAIRSGAALSVVVVGSGTTGVEITGALLDLIEGPLPGSVRHHRAPSWTVHLVDRTQMPLAQMSPASRAYSRDVLTRSGAVLHLGRNVTRVGARSVRLDDATVLRANLTIWAGGLAVDLPDLEPAPALRHGRVVVDAQHDVPGHPGVHAIGDASINPASPLPQLAAVAKQQGRYLGRALAARAAGEQPEPFAYRDLGTMAMVRRHAAVVELGAGHHELEGELAYLLWLGLHASLLPGGRHRLDAVHDWVQERISGQRF